MAMLTNRVMVFSYIRDLYDVMPEVTNGIAETLFIFQANGDASDEVTLDDLPIQSNMTKVSNVGLILTFC